MPKTKISDFSSTPASNTDINSINIAEGCAPSGINDAIRDLMAQLKNWQSGTSNEAYVIGSSGSLTLNQGTANGVPYLNGSKVLTSGSVMVFDGTNLGLGVTPSSWGGSYRALQFASGSITGYSSTSLDIYGNAYDSGAGAWKYQNSSQGAVRYAFYNGQHQWYNAPSGTAGNAITFTQAMTLDASGNLALGTTSATGQASDNRVIQIYGAGTNNRAQIHLCNSTTGQTSTDGSFIGVDTTGGLYFVNKENAPTIFENNGSETARIDSSGNLLLNTTSQNGAGKFSVKYNGSSEQGINIRDTANASGSAYMVFGSSGGTTYGTITNNSNTGVLYNVTSDQRLKENIVDAPEFGSVIDSIQVRSYDWKSNGSHQRAGFIAQELVTVAPEAVHQPTDTDEMMAVDYSKLVPMLVKEVQSLRQRVAQLESK